MFKKYLLVIIVCISHSCKDSNPNSALSNFHEINSIPTNPKECFISYDSNDIIPLKELHSFLINTNEFTSALINQDFNYYYGFKIKLNSDYFLLSITKTYNTIGQFKNVLVNGHDVILYLYNSHEKSIVSSLIILQSDPFLRTFDYKDDAFNIKSKTFFLNAKDDQNASCDIENIEDSASFVIQNGVFEKM